MLVLKQRWQCCAERTVKETLINYGLVQKEKNLFCVCYMVVLFLSFLLLLNGTELVPSN